MPASLYRVDVKGGSGTIALANSMSLTLLRGQSPLPQTVSSLDTTNYLQGATVQEQQEKLPRQTSPAGINHAADRKSVTNTLTKDTIQ